MAAMFVLTFAARSDEAAYVLGAGDVVKVSVYGRSDLSGEFRIRSNGTIVMPLVGSVTAENLSVEQLEASLTTALRSHSVEEASAIVEPVSLRPFYIVGDVTNQGRYPYFPGMRVIEAVAIAGGYRSLDTQFFQVRRDLSAARSEFEVLTNELRTNLARKARLEAERDGASEIKFPDELLSHKGEPVVAALMESETALFMQRKVAVESQAQNIEAQKALFQKESASLEGVMQSYAKQINLLKPQLEAVQKLVERGNAVKSQLLDLQLTYANVETLRLEASVNATRAKERLAELDSQRTSAENDRRSEVMTELQSVEQQLPDVMSRLASAKDLLYLAGELASTDANKPVGPRTNPTIVRTTAEGSTEIAATEETLVLPGDVIKIPIQ